MSAAALWTQVKLIYSTQSLKELTNKRNPGASSIDDTYGQRIATMAMSWFKRLCQQAYDSDDDDHNEVAVQAVYTLLRKLDGKFAEIIKSELEAVEDAMRSLRSTTTNGRPMPTTNSILEPSTEDISSGPDRPSFDTERFNDLTPGAPPAP